MYDTTNDAAASVDEPAFPDDELRRLLQQVVRFSGLLEPSPGAHDHGGVQVSASEVFALAELSEREPLSQTDLGASLGLEKSTVSRLAAHLEGRGWLIRERDPENRRLYRLRLTDPGRDAARRVGEHLRAHHADLLAGLTQLEHESLRIGLTGLIRVIQSHRRSGP